MVYEHKQKAKLSSKVHERLTKGSIFARSEFFNLFESSSFRGRGGGMIMKVN
jgi:hypothetical protein